MKKLTVFIVVLLFAVTSMSAFAAAPTEPASLAKARDAILAEAKKGIKEINVQDLLGMMKAKTNFVLLDIREGGEQGFTIPSSNLKKIPRGLIEWLVGKQIKLDEKVVVYCKSGARGALTTKRLMELGYTDVVNLQGGIVAWLEAGYPMSTYIGNITPTGYKFQK